MHEGNRDAGGEHQRQSDAEVGSETRYAASSGQPQPPNESLLRQVLEETIAENPESLSPEELQTLRDVAKRNRHAAFGVEPVGVALVDSLLTLRVPGYHANEQECRSMSQQIAAAFFDSPAARARLERLWNRLCASTSRNLLKNPPSRVFRLQ